MVEKIRFEEEYSKIKTINESIIEEVFSNEKTKRQNQ